ncbi:bifunctional diguanylate cyclase/phosphodiesterase [Kaistia sp. 32K]|uniref:putative bifunctional diguanylate cyclase/phosphodiesterase n=1 Tax=Kaistia sp. 32K TaxID=2795690 RepID=UPI0019158F79|nr:EAL domain-containing protein [Kaistia sp. 32K]BCP52877.1 bifunctional diguanylate cyclase/phosphodiesterase [Kaistia sp. 32K]
MRIALPVLLVLAGSIVFMIVALQEMAGEVDQIDAAATERSASASLAALLKQMRDVHGDYAVWDDAAIKLYNTVDTEFATRNFKESTRSAVFFDSAYLLDENGQHVFAYRRGGVAPRGPLEEFGSPLQVMLTALARNYTEYDAKAGLMKDRSGAITAVVVGSIYPTSSTVARARGKPRLLVLAHTLDDRSIRHLGNDFAIEGMSLSFDPNFAGQRVPLIDPTGKSIGALTWQERSPGNEAYGRVAPVAYVTLGLIGTTILFLLGIGYANLVSARRRERQAIHDAHHDSLTGLPNRAALTKGLDIAVRRNGTQPLAVIFLDLDGFKEVNDSYGHDTGDRLLERVARGFKAICGQRGLLARVGGDEFALVLDSSDTVAAAEEIANRLVQFLQAPLNIDGRVLTIGTSVGIAFAGEGGMTAEELLRRADVAMYQAKELGRSRVALYDRSIDTDKIERRVIADELRLALKHNALQLVYQPIYDAVTMRPALVEALLRWHHPVRGLVAPDLFVSVAEEMGLMDELGTWVLRHACRDAVAWPEVGLAVNVSPVQFRNPGFDRILATILAETGLPPSRLEIEMTETSLVTYPDRAQNIVALLRIHGISVALDDFGTGYSSIGYLRRFAFDKLKIDRSLVHGVSVDPETRRLCEATIALGLALDLKVTAEGLETKADVEIMRAAGCSHLQGYYFARPMAAEAVTELLARSDDDDEQAAGSLQRA